MRIRLLRDVQISTASSEGPGVQVLSAGTEIDVADQTAAIYLGSGAAEPVREEPAGEKAVKPKAKPRKAPVDKAPARKPAPKKNTRKKKG